MTHPVYSLAMLGFESVSVINKRLAKMARGGPQSAEEFRLMFAEKADAAVEASKALALGATPIEIIARYREHVAANEARLSI